MGIRGLNSESEVRVVASHVGAGTSNYTATPVDMQGFEGVRFIIPISTSANTASVIATFGEGASTSAFTTLSGTSVSHTGTATAVSKVMLCDIYRPKDRYIQATITRATANASVGAITAELYGGSKLSTTNSTAYGVSDTDTVFSPST